VAASDLTDRSLERRRGHQLIEHAKQLAARQVTLVLLTSTRRLPLADLSPDEVLEHRRQREHHRIAHRTPLVLVDGRLFLSDYRGFGACRAATGDLFVAKLTSPTRVSTRSRRG
jgi:hypothetical protein